MPRRRDRSIALAALDWAAAAAAVAPPALSVAAPALPLDRVRALGGLDALTSLHRHRGWLFAAALPPLAFLAAARPRSPAIRPAALVVGALALAHAARRVPAALAALRREPPLELTPEEASRLVPGDAPVLGVEVNGEARAYPLDLFAEPHRIHDVVGGVPLVPTYCERTNAALAFRDDAPGGALGLEAIGRMGGGMVFLEARARGLVPQLEARVASGPFAGAPIETVPLALMAWESWRTLFPGSTVLYAERGRRPARTRRAPRDPAEERVLGIATRGSSKAYPRAVLAARRVIEDAIHGLPLVILFDAERDFARAFDRRLDGRPLAFRADRGEGGAVARAAGLERDAPGSRVDVAGRFLDGPLAGRRLAPIALQVDDVLLSAWEAARPGTELVRL